jgi:hypothetical protein
MVIKWGLAALVLCLIAWGIMGTIHYFKDMNFNSHIRGGDDYLSRGYPGEAETEYTRAKAIFPDHESLAQKFKDVENYRKDQAERRRAGLYSGPLGNEMVNRMRDVEKRQESFAKANTMGEPVVPQPAAPKTIPLPAPTKSGQIRLGGRYEEPAGGYSIQPPLGWQTSTPPGLKYAVFAGRASGGFAPNINVVDENSAADLKTYVNGNLENLAKMLTEPEISSIGEDKLNNGSPCLRFVVRHKMGQLKLSQVMYVTEKAARKYVITGTARLTEFNSMLPTLEGSIKSFQATE